MSLCPKVKALPAWPFFGWSYLCKRIGSEVKSGGLQKGAGCLCQLSKSGFALFPQLSLFKRQKAPLSLWYSMSSTWPNLCHLMKGVQKLIHLKGFLARKGERPTVQGLGIRYFGDHSLYWTALFYNPISVPVKNILQDVKNISYIFCSVEDLFLNTRTTNLKLQVSSVLVLQFTGWVGSLNAFFCSFLGVSWASGISRAIYAC